MKTTRSLGFWLSYLILAVGLLAFTHLAVQQNYRGNADDPQIQIAEDTAASLAAGQQPQAVVPTNTVDLAASLTPAVIVFNQNHQVLASSARLNGQTPIPPTGTFEQASGKGRDRFTWEPQADVRQAAILVPYHAGSVSGYVLASRSLKEVEVREDQLTYLAVFALLAILGATFVITIIVK